MITAIVVGKDGVRDAFRLMPSKASAAMYQEMERLAIKLQRHIKEDKLSGQVLKNRTGNLRRSINYRIEGTESQLTAYVGTNVKYAHIHEYGGKTAAHDIVPRNVKALHFMWQGQERFFKIVHHPGSKMPERSFLRSALEDMQEEIRQRLFDAVERAMQL